MKALFNISALIVVGVLLSACAQQEEPAPAPVVIEPEPTYSKY
jgi:uncharacterized lipoprotein YbaY